MGWPAALAGWLFVAGTVLFSGSLYALALTGERRWAAVAPIGGTCLILGLGVAHRGRCDGVTSARYFFCASSLALFASVMILSARCDGTSS